LKERVRIKELMMSFRPFANVGWAMLVLVNHEAFTMFSLPLIILGEGILLWCVLPRHSFWRSLGRSLGYSLSMNVVSALLGLAPGPLLLGLVEPSSRTFLDPSYYDSSSSGSLVTTVAILNEIVYNVGRKPIHDGKESGDDPSKRGSVAPTH
jgi:hypothetical protein